MLGQVNPKNRVSSIIDIVESLLFNAGTSGIPSGIFCDGCIVGISVINISWSAGKILGELSTVGGTNSYVADIMRRSLTIVFCVTADEYVEGGGDCIIVGAHVNSVT